jgi:hypothetical protein
VYNLLPHFVSQEDSESILSLDARNTVLWAQVRKAKDEFGIEDDGDAGILRPSRHPKAGSSIILGDIMTMLMRVFGAHAPPTIVELPGFDEQRWKIEFGDEEVRVEVESRPYWGFGLFASSFYNRITLSGPIDRRCRLVLDLASAIGRPPWEPVRRGRWVKVTGIDAEQHSKHWNLHMNHCRTGFKAEMEKREQRINEMEKKLTNLDEEEYPGYDRRAGKSAIERALRDIDVSNKALHEDNAAAVERALARIDIALIEANPSNQSRNEMFQEEEELAYGAVSEEANLGDVLAAAPSMPEDDASIQVQQNEEMPIETGATADDLLLYNAEKEEEIPFVDLSISEEE